MKLIQTAKRGADKLLADYFSVGIHYFSSGKAIHKVRIDLSGQQRDFKLWLSTDEAEELAACLIREARKAK